MIPIRQTEVFSEWLRRLRDLQARSIIQGVLIDCVR